MFIVDMNVLSNTMASDPEAAANAMFGEDFADRVLPFDGEAAIAYADVFSARRRGGGRRRRPI
jgi:toxin FitB